jgi:hypothetical protein
MWQGHYQGCIHLQLKRISQGFAHKPEKWSWNTCQRIIIVISTALSSSSTSAAAASWETKTVESEWLRWRHLLFQRCGKTDECVIASTSNHNSNRYINFCIVHPYYDLFIRLELKIVSLGSFQFDFCWHKSSRSSIALYRNRETTILLLTDFIYPWRNIFNCFDFYD